MSLRFIPAVFAVFVIGSSATASENVAPHDFDGLTLGATIVGPVGPEVEASLVSAGGYSVGDINSRVQCPDGVETCAPPKLPADTVYTFIHEITPGVDRPNDDKFAKPEKVVDLPNANMFRLGRSAAGFTGVAGYSFKQADAAMGTMARFTISIDEEGRLVWLTESGHSWQQGKTITFFWQTTQPPIGPRDGFTLSNGAEGGSGIGPAPRPVE